MSNFDKDWLIKEVYKDPGSPYFPVLAHFHLKDKELKKAIAVCHSGLEIYPESIEGNFIMAQIQILEANLHDAEKTLKFKLKNSRNLDRKSLNLLRKEEISSTIN